MLFGRIALSIEEWENDEKLNTAPNSLKCFGRCFQKQTLKQQLIALIDVLFSGVGVRPGCCAGIYGCSSCWDKLAGPSICG